MIHTTQRRACLHHKLCSHIRICCGFCAGVLCIVDRYSLHIRGMIACHVDHVVYLRKHSLVTCLVNAQGGWSLQMNTSHPIHFSCRHGSLP